jgi:hypothetical protein
VHFLLFYYLFRLLFLSIFVLFIWASFVFSMSVVSLSFFVLFGAVPWCSLSYG